MRAALSQQVSGHVSRGKSARAAHRQHHVRVVLAHARAKAERLGRRGAHTRHAVPVGHRLVDPVVDPVRQRQSPIRRLRQIVGGTVDALVGMGQCGRLEQVSVGQPSIRQPVRLRGLALDRDFGDELDRVSHTWREHFDDHVSEPIAPALQARAVKAHRHVVPQPPLVTEALGRDDNQAVAEVADRFRILVAEGLAQEVRRPPGGNPVDRGGLDRHQPSCPAESGSAQTAMDRNTAGPNVVSMATSRASRPRPISTRPTRRSLLRGSNVHQRSPR